MNIIIDKFPGYGMFTKNFKEFDFSIESFRKYNKDVLEFFEDKQDQLLVMDIPNGDGYDKLCKFLNVEYKGNLGKFPNIQEINLQLHLRMKYLFY